VTVDGAAPTCGILVPSCDAYSDLWGPLLTLFGRYWPDCPFPIYLGSNEGEIARPGVTMLPVGKDTDWSSHLRRQLQALPTTFVLLWLEDFFPRRPVPTRAVLECLAMLDGLEGHQLRLIARPGPDLPVAGYPRIGRIQVGVPYRVSTQAAIWRRQTLLGLLRDGESVWQFEVAASRRSDALGDDGFYGVWDAVVTYDHHVVERGKWFRPEARRFGPMGIGCDFSRRPIMTRREQLRWRAGKLVFGPYQLLPWERRAWLERQVRRLLRRGGRA
jgi:hypothetical protein